MTSQEFEYIKRAVQAIEEGNLTLEEEAKVLRTVSQITERGAKACQDKLVDILIA
jgi:hypothetical protein